MKNLKTLTISILSLLLASTCLADTRIGFLGGPIVSDLSSKTLDSLRTDFSSRTGVGLGAVIDLGAEGPLGLRLEPQYVRKGADKILYHPWFGEISSQVDLSYLELPVLLKYALDFDGPRIYATGGGWIGYLLDAQEQFQCDLGRELFGDSRDVKQDMESTDYGYTFGAGVSFPIGSSRLFLESRYAEGMQDIWKGELPVDDPEFEEGTTELETGGWRILAGITFPIGGQPREFFNEQPGLPAVPPAQPAAQEGYDGPGTRDDEQPANDRGDRINQCPFDIDIHMPRAQDPNSILISEIQDAARGSYTLVNDDIDVAPADLVASRTRHPENLRRVQGRPDLSFDVGSEDEDDLVRIDLYNPDGLDNLYLSAFPMASQRGEEVPSRTGFQRKITRDQLRFYRSSSKNQEVPLPHKVRHPVDSLFVEGRLAGRYRIVLFHLPEGTHSDAAQIKAQEVGDPHGGITQGQIQLRPEVRCHRNVRLTVAIVDIHQTTGLTGDWRRQHVFDVLWGGRANLDGRLWPPGGRYQWGTAEGLQSTWVDGTLREQEVRSSANAAGGGPEVVIQIGGGFAPATETLQGTGLYQGRLQLQYRIEDVTLMRTEPVTVMVPDSVSISPGRQLARFNTVRWGGQFNIFFQVNYHLYDHLHRSLIGPPQERYEIMYGAKLRMYEALGTDLNAHETGDDLEMLIGTSAVSIGTAQRSNPVPSDWSIHDGNWEDTFSLEITKSHQDILVGLIRNNTLQYEQPIFRVKQDVIALLENGVRAYDIRVARGQRLEILGLKRVNDRQGRQGALGFRMTLGGANGTVANTGNPDLVTSDYNP